ncbi:threonine-phosphate decarboxylase CobD [Paenibacillus sp. Marseille-Q4541]|uniref:threonine-phosphate decarboxylase CobD n=1 Tax=Paenibacillus sp. Marseille-Q4541 TaxID=2831522 RepID=UPI002018E1F7|nr:threonine-phosphate decarboxylase CobD [Paenibacillus sp. Marseille-Q4541]
MIEIYGHGGDVETAAARYGLHAADFLDYSANINPLGPPAEVKEALMQGWKEIIRYPDPGHRGLKRRLSDKLQLGEEHILVGNGAAECMALLLQALRPETVGTIEPGFSEYRTLAIQFGAKVDSVYGRKDKHYRAEISDIVGLMERVQVLFIGQPNNPNGVQYSLSDLEVIAKKAEQTKTKLVVDEAFIDFIPERSRQSLAPSLGKYPEVIIIRSMTKFYAIPGLRLGFAIASPEIIRAMTKKQVTWSVNGLALLAGEACLQAQPSYEQDTLSLIAMERTRLMDGLSEYGFTVCPGEANYLLVESLAPWTAGTLQEAMGRKGILIRSCAMYPGLNQHAFRIAIKSTEHNLHLLETLGQIMEGQR